MSSSALITSAAYVNLELAAEYGQLPPSFLPFGHRRLYQAQVEFLRRQGPEVFLTLPASFEIPEADALWLEAEDVRILKLADGLSLGASVAQALILMGAYETVRILHGDTLLPELDQTTEDCVSVARSQNDYQWGQPRHFAQAAPDEVLTGWFSFSSGQELLRCLTLASGDFIAGLEGYAARRGLQTIRTPEWLDFGHLQNFHRARARVSTARSFNSLSVAGRTVFKSGDKPAKLQNEAAWFSALPIRMRLFTPTFLGWEGEGYRLAYEFNPVLHELLIFGALRPSAWESIAAGCFEFLETCRDYGRSAENPFLTSDLMPLLATDKTAQRIEEWAKARRVDLDQSWSLNNAPLPPIREILRQTSALIADSAPIPGVMHGDFCFPNIFFDFRQQIVKAIDPRGSVQENQPTIYGDLRYDLAKLNHSIEGYDQILTNRYAYARTGERDLVFELAENPTVPWLRRIFSAQKLGGWSIAETGAQALTIQLFLSMLPLHADRPDRQDAFLANAFRLFLNLDR